MPLSPDSAAVGDTSPGCLHVRLCPTPGTRSPGRPGRWGRGSPKPARGPCRVPVEVARMPAWPLAGCLRGLRVPVCAWSLVPRDGVSACSLPPPPPVPGPRFCSKCSPALPPAHSRTEADICSSWGSCLCPCSAAPAPLCTDLAGLRTGAPSAQVTSCPIWGHPWLPPAASGSLPPGDWARLWVGGREARPRLVGGGRRMRGRPR